MRVPEESTMEPEEVSMIRGLLVLRLTLVRPTIVGSDNERKESPLEIYSIPFESGHFALLVRDSFGDLLLKKEQEGSESDQSGDSSRMRKFINSRGLERNERVAPRNEKSRRKVLDAFCKGFTIVSRTGSVD